MSQKPRTILPEPAAYDAVGYAAPPVAVDITPEMAMAWLDGHNVHNRPLRQARVDRYVRDMRLGRWQLTHQGIAFSKDGVLIDGQHRLWAIVESGCTIKILVHHGLPIASQTVIDTAEPRNVRDRLYLSDRFGEVTTNESNVLRRVVKGAGPWPKLTVGEEQDAFEKHRAAIRFAISCFPKKLARITSAPVLAVIARAWYTPENRPNLKAFANILLTGEMHYPKDRTVLAHRDDLMRGLQPEASYLRTATALRAYLDGRKIMKIFPATEELFMFPGEKPGRPQYRQRHADLHIQTEKIMRVLREIRSGTVTEILKAAELKAGQRLQTKALLDSCVSHGIVSVEKGSGQKGAKYTLL